MKIQSRFVCFPAFLLFLGAIYFAFRGLEIGGKRADQGEAMKATLALVQKEVEARDKMMQYKEFPPAFQGKCPDRSLIKSQPMPWDGRGRYAVPYLDVQVACKKPGEKIVLVIGDSITGGIGLSPDQRYPELLDRRFENTRFINAGVNSASTAHWSADGALYRKTVLQNKGTIDAVLFLLGGNDPLYTRYVLNTEPVAADVGKKLEAILSSIHADLPGVPVYVVNYPLPKVIAEDIFREFETFRTGRMLGVVAGPDLAAAFKGKKEEFMSDGIHLNADGHKHLADLWEVFLKSKGLR